MAGIVQNGQKRPIFIVVPQVRNKMREKGKRERKEKSDVTTSQILQKVTITVIMTIIRNFIRIKNPCQYKH